MTDRRSFVHLSDTHIAPRGELVHGADTAQNLRDVLARVQEMNLDPAFFLISGDLSNHGDAASYEHLRELVSEIEALGAPVLLGLGNHDNRVNFRQVMLGETDAADEDEPYVYAETIGGLRVLMLDSKVPEQVYGELGEEQLEWLEEQLDEPTPGADIVVLHHPSLPRGVPRPDDFLLQDVPPFAALIERHPSVLAVLAGHSHVSSVSAFAGTLHVTAPATAFLLDPSMRAGNRMLAGAGFNVCTVRDGHLIVNPIILPGDQRELLRHVPAAEPAATRM